MIHVSLLTQVVNPEVQLADVHLRVLGPGLRLLQPDLDLLDLVLVLLLPLPRLLLAHLQLLLVVPDGGELVVDPVDLLLGDLDSVAGPGQLVVHHGEGARQVVVLHLIVRRYKHTAEHAAAAATHRRHTSCFYMGKITSKCRSVSRRHLVKA